MTDIDLQESKKRHLILDTCIIQYLSNKKINPELVSYLAELISRGFELAISEISCFELLSGMTEKQEKDGMETLSLFTRYLVDVSVLVGASQLSTVYSQQAKLEKRLSGDPSLADKVIGATSVLTDSFIITANVNDFPRPLFKEEEEKRIYFKDRNSTKMLIVQLLSPNLEVIRQRFSERARG